MALSPLFRTNDAGDGVTKVRSHRQAHPAVTKYRVLDSSNGCSLVELQPFTGKKDAFWRDLVTGNNSQISALYFFLRRLDSFSACLLSCVHRSQAPDEGSHGVCSVVPHSWWPQIFPLEQTGASGKTCSQLHRNPVVLNSGTWRREQR